MHHASEPRLFKGDEATGRHYIQILLLLQRVSARGALVVAWGVRFSRGWTSVFGGRVRLRFEGRERGHGDTASLCKGDGQSSVILGSLDGQRWSHSGHLAEELFLRDCVRQSLTDVPLY